MFIGGGLAYRPPMRILGGVLAVVVLVAGCSSSGSKSATTSSTSPPSTSPHSSVSFGSNGSRDDTFIATLGQSPYATDYAAKTREDLIKYANDFCRQATAPPSPGLQEILAMTPDPSAEKYFGTLAVTTYCPSAAPVLTNFFN